VPGPPDSLEAGIDELIVELLVNTGLRASELCNLNIGDLPIKHGKDCIWVRDSNPRQGAQDIALSQRSRNGNAAQVVLSC